MNPLFVFLKIFMAAFSLLFVFFEEKFVFHVFFQFKNSQIK